MLGEDDGARAAALLSVTPAGHLRGRAPRRCSCRADPEDPAGGTRCASRLLRGPRRTPAAGRDDKVVTAWNGLAVAALADVGALLDRPDLVDAAAGARASSSPSHDVDGRAAPHLARRPGRSAPAVLDDHGDLAEGLLALHQATGDAAWLDAAQTLLDRALDRFVDAEGVVHDTAHDARTP